MGWQGELARRGGRAVATRAGAALISDPQVVAARMRVDADWKRIEGGYAARLGPNETIAVTRRVGRWRRIDPRLPDDRWRGIWRLVGFGTWAGVVGAAWWLGSSKAWGPLRGAAELDGLGATVGAALEGFGDRDVHPG